MIATGEAPEVREPVALAAETVLAETVKADGLSLLLEGLIAEYAHCVASGDMDDWARCGHAVINLIASRSPPPPPTHE